MIMNQFKNIIVVKYFFSLLIGALLLSVNVNAQSVFEVDGVCYRVLTEADDATHLVR